MFRCVTCGHRPGGKAPFYVSGEVGQGLNVLWVSAEIWKESCRLIGLSALGDLFSIYNIYNCINE